MSLFRFFLSAFLSLFFIGLVLASDVRENVFYWADDKSVNGLLLRYEQSYFLIQDKARRLLAKQKAQQFNRLEINQQANAALTFVFPQKMSATLHYHSAGDGTLVVIGEAFPRVRHIITATDAGYLDFNDDDRGDIYYTGVAEVRLQVDSIQHMIICVPQGWKNFIYEYDFSELTYTRIRGAQPEFVATTFPRARQTDLLSMSFDAEENIHCRPSSLPQRNEACQYPIWSID